MKGCTPAQETAKDEPIQKALTIAMNEESGEVSHVHMKAGRVDREEDSRIVLGQVEPAIAQWIGVNSTPSDPSEIELLERGAYRVSLRGFMVKIFLRSSCSSAFVMTNTLSPLFEQETSQKILQHFLDLWIVPEIEKRKAAGTLPGGFSLGHKS